MPDGPSWIRLTAFGRKPSPGHSDGSEGCETAEDLTFPRGLRTLPERPEHLTDLKDDLVQFFRELVRSPSQAAISAAYSGTAVFVWPKHVRRLGPKKR